MLLFLELIEQVCDETLKNFMVVNLFDDQVLKVLRQVEEEGVTAAAAATAAMVVESVGGNVNGNEGEKDSAKENENEKEKANANENPNALLLLKIRNAILRLFVIFVDCTKTMRPDLPTMIGFDTPQVQTQQGLFKLINGFIAQTLNLFESKL